MEFLNATVMVQFEPIKQSTVYHIIKLLTNALLITLFDISHHISIKLGTLLYQINYTALLKKIGLPT